MAYGDNLGHLRSTTGETSEGQSGGYHNIPQTPENASDTNAMRYSLREFDGKLLTPDPDHVKMMRTIATGKSLDPRGEIAGRGSCRNDFSGSARFLLLYIYRSSIHPHPSARGHEVCRC